MGVTGHKGKALVTSLRFLGIRVEPALKMKATGLTHLSSRARKGLVSTVEMTQTALSMPQLSPVLGVALVPKSADTHVADRAKMEGEECRHGNIGSAKYSKGVSWYQASHGPHLHSLHLGNIASTKVQQPIYTARLWMP